MLFGIDSESGRDLSLVLSEMTPAGFDLASRRITIDDTSALTAGERTLIDGMIGTRRAEFASGRVLLRSLAGSTESVMRAPNGSPILPVGVTGSLAHDRRFAVGAVTRRPDIFAVGIDIEPNDPEALSVDEANLIVRHDDIVPTPLAGFVMKEATYKAWSVLGGAMLEHHDVHVAADGTRFEATVLNPSTPAIQTCFSGAIRRATGYWIALVVATAVPSGQPDRTTL